MIKTKPRRQLGLGKSKQERSSSLRTESKFPHHYHERHLALFLYSLNFTLNSLGSSITLRRSVPGSARANGKQNRIIDKDLYDIVRPPLEMTSFHLHGKRKSTYPGSGILQQKIGLRGRCWECKFRNIVLLKGRDGVWSDGDEKVIAREQNQVSTRRTSWSGKAKQAAIDEGVRENPTLVFENRNAGEENDLLTDLMVAVWCAKTWCAETWEEKNPRPILSERSYSWGTYIK